MSADQNTDRDDDPSSVAKYRLAAIAAAITYSRAQLSADVDGLAERILAGDARALALAEAIEAEVAAVIGVVNGLIDNTRWPGGGKRRPEFDSDLSFTTALGILEIDDARLVAIGDIDSDDDEINARFLPIRIARHRQHALQKIDEIDAGTWGDGLYTDEQLAAWRAHFVGVVETCDRGEDPDAEPQRHSAA